MQELELQHPVTAHGETISVLEFNEPTGKDVRELGYPYQMNQDESIKLQAHIIAKYIVRLVLCCDLIGNERASERDEGEFERRCGLLPREHSHLPTSHNQPL